MDSGKQNQLLYGLGAAGLAGVAGAALYANQKRSKRAFSLPSSIRVPLRSDVTELSVKSESAGWESELSELLR